MIHHPTFLWFLHTPLAEEVNSKWGAEPLVLYESGGGGAQCKNLKKWGGGPWAPPFPPPMYTLVLVGWYHTTNC